MNLVALDWGTLKHNGSQLGIKKWSNRQQVIILSAGTQRGDGG
ncbi:Hypothetical protein ABZS17G119_01310 [Kosakonia cowanii]